MTSAAYSLDQSLVAWLKPSQAAASLLEDCRCRSRLVLLVSFNRTSNDGKFVHGIDDSISDLESHSGATSDRFAMDHHKRQSVSIVTTGGTPYTFYIPVPVPQCPRPTPAHSANLIPMRCGYQTKTTEVVTR